MPTLKGFKYSTKAFAERVYKGHRQAVCVCN